jgi:hypothetical protein
MKTQSKSWIYSWTNKQKSLEILSPKSDNIKTKNYVVYI